MAIDFLILFLLLISLIINLLALGGFWVTPGLRTTANRFVINLLIVNIIGCLILAPTLFIRSSSSEIIKKDIKIEDFTKNHYTFVHENNETGNQKFNDTTTITTDEATIIKCNKHNKCTKIRIDNEKLLNHEEIVVLTEMNFENDDFSKISSEDVEYDDEETKKYNHHQHHHHHRSTDHIPTVIETVDSGKNTAKSRIIYNNNREFGVNNNLASTNEHNEIKRKVEGLKSNSISSSVEDSISSSSSSSSSGGISLNYLQENLKNIISSSSSSDSLLVNDNKNISNNNNLQYIPQNIHCWTLDLVAALGALSVLLIVGDTWCAVTDPLRYHSRISGFKAWILIGITWILGIFFGILSALRETTITTTTTTTIERYYHQINNTNNGNSYEMSRFIEESLYNLIFSCVYFIIIILLPFGIVCGMYWRIFSEARENGLRMRQNGSSPLLQSAFNLSTNNHNNQQQRHSFQHQTHLSINNHQNNNNNNISNLTLTKDQGSTGDGLQMRIDHNIKNDANKSILIPPSLLTAAEENNKLLPQSQNDRNHNNILLTLSEATEDLKRNYSSRHLSILGSQDFYDGHCNRNDIIRQVHSTPNLQKYQRNSNDSIIDIDEHHEIISSAVSGQTHQRHHALQLPTIIHTSPKALGYMTSIRHRLSNASSLFKYREESRAARISILVVIMFLVSYLPYGILILLQGRVFQLSNYTTTQLAIFVVLLSNISSPFIFAYRNKRVRRGVKRLFNLDPRAKDRKLLQHQRRGGIIPHNQGGDLIKYPITDTNHNNNNGITTNKTATISLLRNGNKVTTYSIKTKFLTPSHACTAAGTFLVDLEHCHYFKNDYTNNNNSRSLKNCNNDISKRLTNNISSNNHNTDVPDINLINDLLDDDDDDLSDNSAAEHNNNNGNSAEKRSILKIVRDSSRKLGCAGGGGNSCNSSDCENEPTDV